MQVKLVFGFCLTAGLAFAQPAQRVEGFASVVFAHNNHASAVAQNGVDFRGSTRGYTTAAWWAPGQMTDNRLEWKTAPAPAKARTTFVFAAGSSPLPPEIVRGPELKLSVNGEYALSFSIGQHRDFGWNKNGFALRYRAIRNEWVTFGRHRQFNLDGDSGIYELTVPEDRIKAGEGVTIKVELLSMKRWNQAWFMVKDRKDVLVEGQEQLRQEVSQLRNDVNRLSELVDVLLNRNAYPKFEHFPIFSNGYRHLHPADIVALKGGEYLVTAREATEHLAADGDIVVMHSKDGRNWSERSRFGVPNLDEREACGFQLPNGEILLAVFFNRLYRPDGEYERQWAKRVTFGAGKQYLGFYTVRSKDGGRTWSEPQYASTAGMHFSDTEGPADAMVPMPDGSILMPLIGYNVRGDVQNHASVLLRSTDSGNSWQYFSTIANDPGGKLGHFQEPGLVRMKSGHLLAAMRNDTGYIWTAKSKDGGKTWSEPKASAMTGHPADLVQLPDGRVLCTYGLRESVHSTPGGIRAAFSSDEGETWDMEHEVILRNDLVNWDIGYPESMVMPDGRILTVYYMNAAGRYSLQGAIWKP
ncbi:MAG: exo-alpha-sialidase [Acidobacteria bacterium]|nr:exo-alpha-sialidase [Acidobacteriota bacterium]